MLTKHMVLISPATDESLDRAAHILRAGGLVAFPTETVYGLGANACDGLAVAKIFAAKQRPSFNPLIIHGDDVAMLSKYAVFDERALMLAAHFWPGPLSMILPLKHDSGISDLVTAGLDTIAVRVPAEKIARDLIARVGLPIAAPSANPSGQLSPTAAHHVAQGLGEAVDIILAGGMAKVGLESTVVDLTTNHPVILRPGAITAQEIEVVLGCTVTYDHQNTTAPKSPGQLLRHYAPQKKLRLRAVDIESDECLLAFGALRFMAQRDGGAAKDFAPDRIKNLSETGDLYEAASHLFSYLRELDATTYHRIAVMDIPNHGIGIAINDRLMRAAASHSS